GKMGVLADGGRLELRFGGVSLRLMPPPDAPPAVLHIAVDDTAPMPRRYEAGRPLRIVADGPGPHRVVITAEGEAWIDHWVVRAGERSRWFWPLLGGFTVLLVLYGLVVYRSVRMRRGREKT
ncbi:MAG: hypothetical protein N2383_15505, partial [Caldilineales bacterium]|nr:hypothetical protein [Caldilineales bacterium]